MLAVKSNEREISLSLMVRRQEATISFRHSYAGLGYRDCGRIQSQKMAPKNTILKGTRIATATPGLISGCISHLLYRSGGSDWTMGSAPRTLNRGQLLLCSELAHSIRQGVA